MVVVYLSILLPMPLPDPSDTFTRFETEFVAGYVYGRMLRKSGLSKLDLKEMYGLIDEAMKLIGRPTYFEKQALAEIEQLINGLVEPEPPDTV